MIEDKDRLYTLCLTRRLRFLWTLCLLVGVVSRARCSFLFCSKREHVLTLDSDEVTAVCRGAKLKKSLVDEVSKPDIIPDGQ